MAQEALQSKFDFDLGFCSQVSSPVPANYCGDVFDAFRDLDDMCIHSQPLTNIDCISEPAFQIDVWHVKTKTAENVVKRRGAVFRPFSSLQSVELTVRSIREHLGRVK